jgi:hypothetical protein
MTKWQAASAGRVYRVGDRVMQLRNNYDKGTARVFNGSVGVVTAIWLEDSRQPSSAGQGCPETCRRAPLHRPHPTAPAGTGEDRCGGPPALGRPAATGSGPAQGADPRSGRTGRTVRVTPRRRTGLAILESQTRGSVAWFACTAWDEVAKNA